MVRLSETTFLPPLYPRTPSPIPAASSVILDSARPLSAREKAAMRRILTRFHALDLAEMLGVSDAA